MKIILMLICTFAFTGCGTVLMKDCEQQGNSQYYHCGRVWH